MGRLRIEPVDATLGAVVMGVELRNLDPLAWQEVLGAFHDHAVLVFPGQHLTPDEQRAFAAGFGPIRAPEQVKTPQSAAVLPRSDLDHGAFNVANLSRDGLLVSDPDDEWLRVLAGNFEWHTASSYMPVSAQASMLTAHVLPDAGGETEWAEMRAAYACLDETTRARIEHLNAFHSFAYAQSRLLGAQSATVDHRIGARLRPLVKVHSVTARRRPVRGPTRLRHPRALRGGVRRPARLAAEFACQPDRIYTHRWSVGDLVVWDNRAVLHRGRPWDFGQLRHLVHSRVAGDPASEGASGFG